MPYKLRKAPNRDLYWVVGEDGTKKSKEPIPLERAKAQMRALYASEGKMRGGATLTERAIASYLREKWYFVGPAFAVYQYLSAVVHSPDERYMPKRGDGLEDVVNRARNHQDADKILKEWLTKVRWMKYLRPNDSWKGVVKKENAIEPPPVVADTGEDYDGTEVQEPTVAEKAKAKMAEAFASPEPKFKVKERIVEDEASARASGEASEREMRAVSASELEANMLREAERQRQAKENEDLARALALVEQAEQAERQAKDAEWEREANRVMAERARAEKQAEEERLAEKARASAPAPAPPEPEPAPAPTPVKENAKARKRREEAERKAREEADLEEAKATAEREKIAVFERVFNEALPLKTLIEQIKALNTEHTEQLRLAKPLIDEVLKDTKISDGFAGDIAKLNDEIKNIESRQRTIANLGEAYAEEAKRLGKTLAPDDEMNMRWKKEFLELDKKKLANLEARNGYTEDYLKVDRRIQENKKLVGQYKGRQLEIDAINNPLKKQYDQLADKVSVILKKNGWMDEYKQWAMIKDRVPQGSGKLRGSGIWDIIKDAVNPKKVANEIFNPQSALRNPVRKDFPPSVKKFIGSHNKRITGLQIRRDPVSSAIHTAFNILSAGQWEKAKQEENFDRLFHLGIVLTLEGNEKVLIEKNEVINVGTPKPQQRDSEIINNPYPADTTLSQFLERGVQRKGDSFFTYDPFNNNCQDFVLGLLYANGVETSKAERFVKQDVSSLVAKLPDYVGKVAKGITDIGAVANRVLEGGRLPQQEPPPIQPPPPPPMIHDTNGFAFPQNAVQQFINQMANGVRDEAWDWDDAHAVVAVMYPVGVQPDYYFWFAMLPVAMINRININFNNRKTAEAEMRLHRRNQQPPPPPPPPMAGHGHMSGGMFGMFKKKADDTVVSSNPVLGMIKDEATSEPRLRRIFHDMEGVSKSRANLLKYINLNPKYADVSEEIKQQAIDQEISDWVKTQETAKEKITVYPKEERLQNLFSVLHRLTGRGKFAESTTRPDPAFGRQLQKAGIEPSAYLEEARRRAKKHHYPYKLLGFATDGKAKLAIPDENGRVITFGRIGYGDHLIYSHLEKHGKVPKGTAESKQSVFQKSHTKIKGDWKKNPFSANHLALRILW